MRRLLPTVMLIVSGCAGMSKPAVAVEIAFGYDWNDASPVFIDVTADVRNLDGIIVDRPKARLPRTRPSSTTVVLDNTDRLYDPDYTAGTYYGELNPMTPIRIRVTHNAVTYDLFRGFVSSWGVSSEVHDHTVAVQALDGLTVLQMLKIGSPFERQIRGFGADVRLWYRFSEPVGATVVVDSSGNRRDGVAWGAVTFGAAGGMATTDDRAATFGGVNSQIELPATAGFAGSSARSVEAWFTTSATGDQGLDFYIQFQNTMSGWLAVSLDSSYFAQAQAVEEGAVDNFWILGAAALNDGLLHQIVYTDSGAGAITLYVDGASVNSAALADSPTLLQQRTFAGANPLLSRWDQGDISELILYDTELTPTEVLNNYTLGTTPWDNQLTSARITALLDMIGWPSALRDLDTGLSTMNQLASGQITALAAIWEAVDTENGAAWIDGAGKLLFANRRYRDVSTYQATFSAASIPFRSADAKRDAAALRTVSQISDTNDAVTEYVGANEAPFGPRVVARSTQTTSVTEPYDYATWLYGEHGTSLTDYAVVVEAHTDTSNANWASLLGLDLGDLVRVVVAAVEGIGSDVDVAGFVESIHIQATTHLWRFTIGVSNAAGQRGFVLDNATIGVLDGAGRLGF